MNDVFKLPGRATRVGWQLPQEMTRETWVLWGRMLDEFEAATQWWRGDWWVYGSRQWGEGEALAEQVGVNYNTVRQYGSVSRAFELCTRVHNLTFWHHRNAMTAPIEDRLEWLARAAREGWSAAELRRQINQRKNKFGAVDGPDGACCGFDALHQLVAKGYRAGNIYADPPWQYDNQGTRASTGNHYAGLTVDQLCDPDLMPIAKLAAADAHLHLWTTNAFLFDCARIFDAWGFEFRTTFVWVKPEIGIGNYWRNSHEFMLTGIRGNAKRFDQHDLPSWLKCSRGTHSSKPDQVRDMIAKVSPTPRLELFARSEHDGWLSWGDQIESNLFSKRLETIS